jgi:hypothetical protein
MRFGEIGRGQLGASPCKESIVFSNFPLGDGDGQAFSYDVGVTDLERAVSHCFEHLTSCIPLPYMVKSAKHLVFGLLH